MRIKTIWSLLVLLLIFGTFAFLEHWAKTNFTPVKYDTSLQEKLEQERPDVICIGNSMLGMNIVKERLHEGLKAQFGRPIKIFYIGSGGLHPAWQYLVLKNQVAQTTLKNIPIIFFDYEDYFTRNDSISIKGGNAEVILRKNMTDSEPAFFSKIGGEGRLHFASGFPYLFNRRYQIKRWLVSNVVINALRFTGTLSKIHSGYFKSKDEKAVRWLFGKVFRGERFRDGELENLTVGDREVFAGKDEADFIKIAEGSFLPEMLKFKDRFQLIFIESSSNPAMTRLKTSLQLYGERLSKYLESNGAAYIDMNRVPELQDSILMHDTRHFRKGAPQIQNTEAVLRELAKIRLR